jgi:uncharacterized protein YceK
MPKLDSSTGVALDQNRDSRNVLRDFKVIKMARLTSIILMLSCLSMCGCGTLGDAIAGPVDDRVFFRGVRLDICAIKEDPSLFYLAVDIPFSAVADTLLIPRNYYRKRFREANFYDHFPIATAIRQERQSDQPIILDLKFGTERFGYSISASDQP